MLQIDRDPNFEKPLCALRYLEGHIKYLESNNVP